MSPETYRISRSSQARSYLSLFCCTIVFTSPTASPISRLARQYGVYLDVDYALKEELCKAAVENQLGVRYIYAQLKMLIDEMLFDNPAFCGHQWPPVRLPVATRRCQWTGLISYFSFDHYDVMFRHPFEKRVGGNLILHQHRRPCLWLALRADNAAP